MRGEVLLLSSNVKITGNTGASSRTPSHPEPYGCHILIADFFDVLDNFKYNAGSIIADNIEVSNCSQLHKSFAGINFNYAVSG